MIDVCSDVDGICSISGMPIDSCVLHPDTQAIAFERMIEQRRTDAMACSYRGELVGHSSCSCAVITMQPIYRCTHPLVGGNCVDLLPPSDGSTDCQSCIHGPHLRS